MAWALLSHTGAVSTSSNQTVTSPAIDTTGAKIIVMLGTGETIALFTDSQSNANVYRCPKILGNGGYGINCSVIVNPTTSPTHTFTYAGTINAFPGIAVLAFTGSFGGIENFTAAHTNSGTSLATGSLTPSTNNALLVSGYYDTGTSGTRSIDSGFTITDQFSGNAHANGTAGAYLIQTTAAAANPTWTTTAPATELNVGMWTILLQAAASGGGASASVFVS